MRPAHLLTFGAEDPTAVGEEPDYRFSFANERTMLAWLRTSLGLLVAGLATAKYLPDLGFQGGGRYVALPAVAAGLVLPPAAYRRWAGNERAMRQGLPLPGSGLLACGAWVVAIAGAAAIGLLLFEGR